MATRTLERVEKVETRLNLRENAQIQNERLTIFKAPLLCLLHSDNSLPYFVSLAFVR